MLVEFSVENFLSFKDMATLSLEASADKESPQNVIESAQGTDLRLLTGAAIYGPNASGKSNFFKAIKFMRSGVITSAQEGIKEYPTIRFFPFKLDQTYREKPSTFEIVFLMEGVRYLYGFSVDSQRVHEEWLYSYPHNRKRLLFERRAGRADSSDPAKAYKFGGHWTGESKRLAGMTRPDSLFISIAAQFNHPQATMVVDWFSKKLHYASPSPTGGPEDIFTIKMCRDEADLKQAVLRLLKNADLHIADFDIHSQSLKKVLDSEDVPLEHREEIIKNLEADPEKPVLRVTTIHQGIDKDGKQVLIPLSLGEESDGTQKYFALAGPLIHVLSKGCCLLADELDLHLHPILARAIVALFHNPKVNTKGAQLVFATHNTDLIEQKGLLRRDQIWLTEKKESGATDLYSAWDFKARKG
ncbi:MAG: ATP-binding protein, partial [Thermodesulfobacteriota bacterium]|nr:ATP-binding protein [Thermodesulfobacteriota bacterium]